MKPFIVHYRILDASQTGGIEYGSIIVWASSKAAARRYVQNIGARVLVVRPELDAQ